ncbi:hypothetical protein Scep_014575 [Stephania cephalantha]|uniref:Uncharacterized protein n=1 Tax=Stephania cephalantha TaxID=152367 RepID=A0AAP0J1H9_9MAGN
MMTWLRGVSGVEMVSFLVIKELRWACSVEDTIQHTREVHLVEFVILCIA